MFKMHCLRTYTIALLDHLSYYQYITEWTTQIAQLATSHHFSINVDFGDLKLTQQELCGDQEVGGYGLVVISEIVAGLVSQGGELQPQHSKETTKKKESVDSVAGRYSAT